MGKTGVQKDKEGKEVKFYVATCNNCEKEVRLSSTDEITPEEVEELQKRLLCSDCLNKKLAANK